MARFASGIAVVAVVAVAVFLPRAAGSQSGPPRQTRLNDVVPAGVRTTQLALTPDARRAYYGDSARAIWLYDRTDKRNVRLTTGEASDLTMSPAGDAIAYVKNAPGTADRYVWVLSLDPRTGLARGAERRVSALQGDTPAISPDGKWVAFAADDSTGVGQGVAIAPVAAGRDRLVVPFLRASVSAVRWSPDSRSLYFAVNPPVACDPEWSCLPLKDEFKQRTGTMRRVAVSGGTPSVVAPRIGGGWPGLSADGSLLVYSDTGYGARVIVADTTGRVLQSFAVPGRETVEGWLSGSTLLLSDRGDVRRLQTYAIADGASRVLSDTLDALTDGAFSPDGRTASAARCVGDRCELRVIGTDGAPVKTIALPDRYGGGNSWSPDGKWIAYVGGPTNGDRKIELVEVATGRIVPATTIHVPLVGLQWLPDSRNLIVTLNANGAQRRIVFEQVSVDGTMKPLRELVVGASPNTAVALDEHTALLLRNGEVRRVSLDRGDADSTESLLMPLNGVRAGAIMAFAPGARRVAFRHRAGDGETDAIEAINLDGSNHVTIELPFSTFPGIAGFRMLPRGTQAVVIGAPYQDEPNVGLYLIDFPTKTWKKLVTIPTMSFAPELAVSFDGRTLLYMTNSTGAPRVFTMDLSAFKR